MSKEMIDLENTWMKPFDGEEISATAVIEENQKRTKKMIKEIKKKEKKINILFFLTLFGGMGFGIIYVIQGFAWFHAIVLAMFAFNGWCFRRISKKYGLFAKALNESIEDLAKMV
jgi:hypothetical protein